MSRMLVSRPCTEIACGLWQLDPDKCCLLRYRECKEAVVTRHLLLLYDPCLLHYPPKDIEHNHIRFRHTRHVERSPWELDGFPEINRPRPLSQKK